MTLQTVADYVARARVLLQDEIAPYRYTDLDLVEGLNMALNETRRLRPELLRAFFSTEPPSFTTASLLVDVPMDPQYRQSLLYYIVGHVQMRDDEVTQDSRAVVMLNKFVAQMLTIQS